MKVEFNLHGDERRGARKTAKIVETIPVVGDVLNKNMGERETVAAVCKPMLDAEQPNDGVFDYDIYAVDTEIRCFDGDKLDDDFIEEKKYFAIEWSENR